VAGRSRCFRTRIRWSSSLTHRRTALRYDDAGRLRVRTMRGTGRTTVFDVFAPNASYVGEVTLPLPIEAYSPAGSYLATAGERADGVPVVVLWTVR
jgi:YD repeat-containing protein